MQEFEVQITATASLCVIAENAEQARVIAESNTYIEVDQKQAVTDGGIGTSIEVNSEDGATVESIEKGGY